MKKRNAICSLILAGVSLSTLLLQGCGSGKTSDGKIEVELLQYKPEAVAAFEAMEERFNATHDNIHLTIESPNEAVTVLKTRLIREDYPDIIGIGGDINYSNFLDANLFMDISDFEGVADIKIGISGHGKRIGTCSERWHVCTAVCCKLCRYPL